LDASAIYGSRHDFSLSSIFVAWWASLASIFFHVRVYSGLLYKQNFYRTKTKAYALSRVKHSFPNNFYGIAGFSGRFGLKNSYEPVTI
jgi:hypothetical protein